MSLASAIAKTFRLGGRSLSVEERDFLLGHAMGPDVDDTALEAIAIALADTGMIAALGPILAELHKRLRARDIQASETIQRLEGFQALYNRGISIPPRGPLRIVPRDRVALSFVHSAPPYNTSGYSIRTHSVARAALHTGKWSIRPHTRIGFPWDVRGAGTPPASNRTVYEGVEYLHDKGITGARGNMADYLSKAAVATERAIFRQRPALVHAASAYGNALPALIGARRAGIPFVYEVRGLWELTYAVGRDNWQSTEHFQLEKHIESVIAREADGVIAITKGVRDELIARGVDPKKIILSPNAIDPDEFNEVPYDDALAGDLGITKGVSTIGYIGSFVDYEGLELLLDSIAVLKNEGLEFNALLVGDGRGYQPFKEKVIALGLEDFVKAPGRIAFNDVPRYYSLIDIAPFPRLPLEVCELVSPLKPLEALALGKLVVASSVGGLREIIEHDMNGLVFTAGDGNALTDVLRDAIRHPKKLSSLRQKGRNWVCKHRLWSSNIQDMNSLFERLAPPKGHAKGQTPVAPSTLISASITDFKSTTQVIARFHMENGKKQKITQPVLSFRNDKAGIVDFIAPPQTVSLIDVDRTDSGPTPTAKICDIPAMAETARSAVQMRLGQNIRLGHNNKLLIRVPVTAGTTYKIHYSVSRAAAEKNRAMLQFSFPGAAGTPSGDVRPQGKTGQYYAYIKPHAGTHTCTFKAPAGASEAIVIFRLFTRKQTGPVEISPVVTVSAPDETTRRHELSHLGQVTQNDGLEKIVLSNDGVFADFDVEPQKLYEIGTQISLAHAEGETDRAVLLTIDFGDNKDGALAKATGLGFSPKLGVYYAYLSGVSGDVLTPFTAPRDVTKLRIGLKKWRLSKGTAYTEPVINLRERQKSSSVIEYNIEPSRINILVFADLNLNLIDGSAIWLMSVTEAFARVPNTVVHLLCRNPLYESPFLQSIRRIENCRILDPMVHLGLAGAFASEDAADVISNLDEKIGGFDYIVARGFSVCTDLALNPRFGGRLCPYLTDIPQQESELTPQARDAINAIFGRSHRVLLQSKWLIEFVAGQFPQYADKISILPPMVPVDEQPQTVFAGGIGATTADDIKDDEQWIVYAGKMAPEWGILELFEAFDSLRQKMPQLRLLVIGSKIHNPPDNPSFEPAVRARLAAGNGLTHRSEMSRSDILRLLPKCHVGWAWRDPVFENANLELSTKLLEYGFAGLPSILTRTDRYEEFLGKRYPFFADDGSELADVLRKAVENISARQKAQKALGDAVHPHRIDVIARDRLAPLVKARKHDILSVLFAGHDLKFASTLESNLIRRNWRVRRDVWQGHNIHDEVESRRLLARSDIIFCEWSLGNLAWYSKNVGPHQRLITRFHMQEIDTEHPAQVDWNHVYQIVFVSEPFRNAAIAKFGIPPAKCKVIPNLIDCTWFNGHHNDESRFTLGILGVVPERKRLDRALNIVERLRAVDPRYNLRVIGKLPHELPWMAARQEELAYYNDQYHRIVSTPALAEGVRFDGFSLNMPAWYNQVDFMLSPSDDESFHMSVAESAAGGTIPIIFPWPAAASIYPKNWIVADENAAVEKILAFNKQSAKKREEERRAVQEHIRKTFNADKITSEYETLFLKA